MKPLMGMLVALFLTAAPFTREHHRRAHAARRGFLAGEMRPPKPKRCRLTTALLPRVFARGDAPSTAIDRGRMSGASASELIGDAA